MGKWWIPEMPYNSKIGLRDSSAVYYFFYDNDRYTMNDSMEATDEWSQADCIGIATLKSGSIHIIVKEDDNSRTYYDINYTKVG